ncbi:uncharacterized protein N7479_001238 [Penicillium vulpinum]|uniref:Major facilitator superfamily (MFS) profile domain-containing protein n=1 Tax=Penicillium vulpinum TaxID=29845 RepID=A0A1V6RYX1_9EURO|nr:uncharacterized protein N7479_001238 [Penicillium vulpinum]KAJ5971320.1 hypothetical protein N7479_001238 [Penicillium vulpinum]OQE06981.1 hypothetical protein PENVUL_c015G02241 [Penicillium vulpinum]
MSTPDIEYVGDSKSPVNPKADSETNTSTAEVGEVVITLTKEENDRIKKKTDRVILAILTWVYFLQVLDKGVLGTAALFNLQADLGLVGNQYSIIGSIAPIAQLGWQPFSAWILVRVPPRILMPCMVLGWGIAVTCMAACNNFGTFITARFFMGLFEAGCLPLFTILTSRWYRRIEQPVRVSIWNGMNGTATMAAAALSYGLGHIQSDVLRPWQIIFLFVGLGTVVTAPFVYWKLDNDITTARFLTEHERQLGVERLRANQMAPTSYDFKWSQAIEAFMEPKSLLWIALALLPNMGSALPSLFGPLIVTGFGFDKYETSLLNIPYGALTTIVIIAGCWCSYKVKLKSAVLVAFMIPVVVGTAMLYAIDHSPANQGPLLLAYYLTTFLYAANPILLSWVVGNTAGAAKTSTVVALYQIGTSAGAMSGSYLFSSDQAPNYLQGIRSVLGLFIALIGGVGIQTGILFMMNRHHKKQRISNGKAGDIKDMSMTAEVGVQGKAQEQTIGEVPFKDVTDWQNDEFVYIY